MHGSNARYERLASQAHLNLGNKEDDDGCVRGSVLPKDVEQAPLSKAVALVTLFCFVSWPYIMFYLFIFSFFSRIALTLFLIAMSTLCLPAQLLWRGFTQSYLLRTWQEYFRFSWTCEEIIRPTDAGKNGFIFAEFPHGAFPMGPILAAGSCSVYFPDQDVYALAASVLFWVPGYKHFMRWVGCLPASRANLNFVLLRGSVAVMVGGIAEMFMLSDDHEEVLVRSRRGVFRASVQNGAPIVPVYHLGNSAILKFGPPWLRGLSRRLRMSVGLVYGKWGPIPLQHRVHMVTGKVLMPEPMDLAPADEGYSQALDLAVDRMTERFATELKALYERHRHVIPGWENRPLIIR